MSERRYSEEEVAAIFERAAEAQQTSRGQLTSGDGMTLAELQEIGTEAGIPAELVAQAARSMELSDPPVSRRLLGFPIGVGRTIHLGRRLSDAEWERFVVDLRDTFDARGTVRYDGPFRQWTNGNLQALLEPTATGDRIRLRTVRGVSRSLMSGGVGLVVISGATLLLTAVTGQLALDPEFWGITGFLAAVGMSMFGAGALRLPGWARVRRRQMEGIAERVALASERAAAGDDADGS